jgi:dihydroorotase
MHEGNVSAYLGLTGIPSIAEEIIVQRDIQLVRYTGSRLHFHGISAGDSLKHIQKARTDGLAITCDVSAMHLLLEDKDVGDFDSNRKILPPLRQQKDRKALIKAVKDGTIQHISSIHTPLEIEAKACEFTYASFGSVGLESAFAAAHTALHESVPIANIIEKFCDGPRKILGFEVPEIKVGELADL